MLPGSLIFSVMNPLYFAHLDDLAGGYLLFKLFHRYLLYWDSQAFLELCYVKRVVYI
jgi:hypothetical protein